MSDSTAESGKAAASLLARAGKQAGFVGAAIGVVAAGAAAGVAIERMTGGREVRRQAPLALDAAAPEGPLVLAGHSMGGMTIMALAEQFPELVAERVAGVFFAGTSAGKLAAVSLGLPAVGARAFRALAPGVLRALGSQTELVE